MRLTGILCALVIISCKQTNPVPMPAMALGPRNLKPPVMTQTACSQILGASWNPQNSTCQKPTTLEECRGSRASLVWDGSSCVEGGTPKNFYRLCLDSSNLGTEVQKTIQAMRAPYGNSGCQSVNTQLLMANSLDLGSYSITDLTPLQSFIQLEKLNLWNNRIVDVSPLQGLTRLKELNLGKNQISDIAPLAALKSLETLFLFENQITTLKPLVSVTTLTTLSVENNKIMELQIFPSGRLKNYYTSGNPGSPDSP